jgi:hypothetical protein
MTRCGGQQSRKMFLGGKAGHALDDAMKKCGGKEWPDEDDLP